MNVKEFYEVINGDYEDMKNRLNNDELMTKIIKMFLNDTSYHDLKEGLAEGDGEKAFRAAHTLKGVCLNLGLSNLSSDVSEFTEDLRGRQIPDDFKEKFQKITDNYNKTIEAITLLD